MKRTTVLGSLVVILSLASVPVGAGHFHSCESLNYITHGTFHETDDCMRFVDDTGVTFEIVNRGSWKDGVVGTIYAQVTEPGECGSDYTIQICDWDADYSRNVVGTLVFKNFIECPGYYIRQAGVTPTFDYFIRNREDFPELFVQENLGKKVRAELLVHTFVSNCIGQYVSDMIDYDFVPQQ